MATVRRAKSYFGSLLLILFLSSYGFAATLNTATDFVWKLSLPIPPYDGTKFNTSIGPFGGTEIRALEAMGGKLYAGVGYWEDISATDSALPGAQIYRLDGANEKWKVDLELKDVVPAGKRNAGRHVFGSIDAMKAVTIERDGAGKSIGAHTLLLASALTMGSDLTIFTKELGSENWSRTALAPILHPGREWSGDLRSFAKYRDKVTGADLVFAGASDLGGGLYVGAYDSKQKKLVFGTTPEVGVGGIQKGRFTSFAECNGKLYTAFGSKIFERQDGPSPKWLEVFSWDYPWTPGLSGFRGMTTIANPEGRGEALLVTFNGSTMTTILRVIPGTPFKGEVELHVRVFVGQALSLGHPTRGGLIGYSDMVTYPGSSSSCPELLIGTQFERDHCHLLARKCDGSAYVLQEVRDKSITPIPSLVAIRTIINSPFADDPKGTIYAGGFDADNKPAHNTAWLYKGVPSGTGATWIPVPSPSAR
jgi:hypothetical protein